MNAARRIIFRLNAIYGYVLFRRWGVHIKLGARIAGSQYIKIGTRFGAGDHFWLSAIELYRGERFTPEIIIGDDVSISDFCHIAAINRIEIGSGVLIGSKVHITDHSHGNYVSDVASEAPTVPPIKRKLFSAGSVKIGSNVWIGDGVVVLPNVVIGDGAIVGANSVVSRNVPANTMVAGVPARIVKTFENGRWCRNGH